MKIKISTFYLIFILLIITETFMGCSGCSKSGRRNKKIETEYSESRNKSENSNQTIITEGKSSVKMESELGVYHIWVEVNDTRMRFIFDTGASNITISQTEAAFLWKQGTISYDDFLREESFQVATGEVMVGAIINLKKVKIANRLLTNVEAVVVPNDMAPLLLGQSVLERLGKYSVDYKTMEIQFY